MAKITFHYEGQVKTFEAPDGQTILQIALDNGIYVENACGGNGFCTTCICTVKEGMQNLTWRNDREESMGVTMDPYRLSCQARASGDVTIEVSDNS